MAAASLALTSRLFLLKIKEPTPSVAVLPEPQKGDSIQVCRRLLGSEEVNKLT